MSKLGAILEGARAKPAVVLTPRQLVCARLVAMGLMQKEIADELKIAESTVDRHMQDVNQKLGTHSPIQTARMLLLLGWMEIDDFLQPDLKAWRKQRYESY